MHLNKELLKELFTVIEDNMRTKGEYFDKQVRDSTFGELEIRTFAGTFIFYKAGTSEQYAMFSVEFDATGKIIRFIAPALLRATIYWDMVEDENSEPEYRKVDIEEMLINAVTNHFKTAL